MSRFETGRIYDRRVVHAEAAAAGLRPGNATAGIVQIGNELCVFWNPFRGLYANRWIDDPGEFEYSGEGSQGAMAQTSGNRLLADAEAFDRRVTMFYKTRGVGSEWQCYGQYLVVEHTSGVSVDRDGKPRGDIRFRLVGVGTRLAARRTVVVKPIPPPELPCEDVLWEIVDESQRSGGAKRRRGPSSSKDKRQSDPLKTMYVRRRAISFGGACELCERSPGWVSADGHPHFQAHHIQPDVDLVDWIAAVCGSCHDRLHHSTDRVTQAATLRATVKNRQLQSGRPTYELHELPDATGQ